MFLEYKTNKTKLYFIRIKESFCGRMYLVFYRLMNICEANEIKEIVDNNFNTFAENQRKIDILEQNKASLFSGIEALKDRIVLLEKEVEYYKARERFLDEYAINVEYLRQAINELYILDKRGDYEQISLVINQIKSHIQQ